MKGSTRNSQIPFLVHRSSARFANIPKEEEAVLRKESGGSRLLLSSSRSTAPAVSVENESLISEQVTAGGERIFSRQPSLFFLLQGLPQREGHPSVCSFLQLDPGKRFA